MAFQLQLSATGIPPGSCYPATWAQALVSIAQNLFVTGLGALNSFNYGPTTPATDLQDRPWIRTDALYKFIGIYTFTGGSWQPANPVILPGTVQDFFGASSSVVAPYYICNGQAIVGPTSGALTTPNLSGLVTLGTGTNPATGTVFANKATGGEESHQLSINEMPSHTHSLDMRVEGGVPATGGVAYGNASPAGVAASTQPTGGNLAHNNLQPYMALYKIIFWP